MTDSLSELGFSAFFDQQIPLDSLDRSRLARIIEIQRTQLVVSDGNTNSVITLGGSWFQLRTEQRPTVGDWVVVDENHEKVERLLERKSVFTRLAVGKKVDVQLIAANVDILFIVTSCNDDFNEARMERYLAMAMEANILPVVVITKSDLTDSAVSYRERMLALQPNLAVELVNALSTASLNQLLKWATKGTTIALVGSSGVGKSTIVNLLAERHVARTADIREQDAKGRHTTSYRSLHKLPSGGLLLDLPGMREVKVADLESGVGEVFSDIESLAQKCKFSDCAHLNEPGCEVAAAIKSGTLDERRMDNYRKLLDEESRQASTLADQRHRNKQLGKSIRQHTSTKQQRKNSTK